MRSTPNLAGKRRGRLKVLRLLSERSASGDRLWECRCKCRRKVIVPTRRLQSGHTRSCGCLKRCRWGQPYTKAKSRTAYAGKARLFVDGRWWYSPVAAQRYLGVLKTTINGWKESCPWLGGKGLETLPMEGAHGRTYTYFAKDRDRGLDAVLRARQGRAPRPDVPDHVLIVAAAKELGVHPRQFRYWMGREDEPAVRVPSKGTDGRPTFRSYISRAFVEKWQGEAPR